MSWKKTWYSLKIFYFLLPLLIFPWSVEMFERPKNALFFVYAVSLFAYLVLEDRVSAELVLKRNKILLYFFTLFFCLTLTSVVGVDFIYSLLGNHGLTNGLLQILSILLLLWSFLIFKEHGYDSAEILEPLSLSLTLSALIGIVHFVLAYLRFINSDFLYDGRAVSTIGQPNFLATLLSFNIIYLMAKPHLLESLARILQVIINLLCFVAAFSRTALAGLAIVAFVALLRKKLYIPLVFLIIIVLVSTIFVAKNTNLSLEVENYAPYYQIQRILDNDKNSLRGELINTSLEAITKSPLVGYGKGHINSAFYSVMSEASPLHQFNVAGSHNILGDIIIEGGIIALIPFSIFLLEVIKRLMIANHFVYSCLLYVLFLGSFTDLTSVLYWVAGVPILALLPEGFYGKRG